MSKLSFHLNPDRRRRSFARLAAIALGICRGCVPAASQERVAEVPATSERLLVRVHPTGSHQDDKKVLDLFMRLFKSEEIQVDSGLTIADLARQRCGRVDDNWIKAFLKKNPSIVGNVITDATTVIAPPCPFWRRATRVKIPEGGTVSDQLVLQMGNAGPKTLDAVAKRNGRSVKSLNWVTANAELDLPYVTSYNSYVPNDKYKSDPNRVTDSLKQASVYVSALPQHNLTLIAAASNSDCRRPVKDAEWPFSTTKLRKVLEFNNTKRRKSPRRAVIAVADTGLAENEQRVFLDVTPGENMDSDKPSFPALDEGYNDGQHGTHVAGIALGGLNDAALNELVKERVAIRVINMVNKEVIATTTGPLTRFSIPNQYLLKAIQHAAQDPPVQVINLSVETNEISGLEGQLHGHPSIVVAAAGNDDLNIDEEERYPAALSVRDRLISVAALDGSGTLTGFSNWGTHNVDLAAPGCLIDSILPEGKRGALSGTSQAAPLVSFTAALLYSEGLTADQIKDRILLTTKLDHLKLGVCSGDAGRCVSSEGSLDIIKALQIYQDVLVRRNPDGSIVTMSGRVQEECLTLDRHCYDVRGAIARLLHDPKSKESRVWLRSKGRRINGRPCVIRTRTIKFQETPATQAEDIPMDEVLELVTAVF